LADELTFGRTLADLFVMESKPTIYGQYVKLKSGQIVELRAYDPENRMLEVKSRTGIISVVSEDDISLITEKEQEKLLKLKTNLKLKTLPKDKGRG
jgi:hypothetical protein